MSELYRDWKASQEVEKKEDERGQLFKELRFDSKIEMEQQHGSELDQLEIIDNQNQKIKIRVPARPQKYSLNKLLPEKVTRDMPKHAFYSAIPNAFDHEARNRHFLECNFRTNYQSGYAPA